MKSARKVFPVFLGLLLTLLPIQEVMAAQVKKFILSMDETRPGLSSNHTWNFTHTSAASLKSITFSYCKTPSGSCVARPVGLEISTATEGSLTNLGAGADWTLNISGTHPRLEYVGTSEGVPVGANTPVTIVINSLLNNGISGSECQNIASNNSAATCYVRLNTYTSVDNSSPTDEGLASYTVVEATAISVRVDPTFSFVITQRAADLVHNDITTSVASTYQTIPFGNLTASTPKYAAHQLNVTTNTENGYTVSMKMLTQMAGVYTSNNIDPFAAASVGWSTPQNWSEPNGTTPNDNTGWIGANTTDTDVSGWGSGSGKFGPVNNTANIVMQGSRSDNGSGAVYVTYAIEANVFQPADTYTGTIVYNALPTY